MTFKTILYFTSVCFVLGKPSIILEQFAPPRINSHLREVKIPPYMVHLYQSLTGKNKDLPRPEKQILEESDTVQSFPAKNCTVKNNHWSLTFDLPAISRSEELCLVELKVQLPSFEKSSNLTLEIYNTENGQRRFFLGSVMTNISVTQHSSWKIFNITKMMEQYLQRENTLSIHESENSLSDHESERNKVASNLEYKIHTDVSLQKNPTDEAIIVFFTKYKSSKRMSSSLKKLSASSIKIAEFRRHKRTRNNKLQTIPANTNAAPTEETKPLCRKVDMMVDFKEIGFDNWIFYPKKYNAYRCEGTCPNPLKETSKTTNYDYIKSYLKLQDPEKIECSSCVPMKMRPLSVTFHENSGLVLRHLEDMIVEDCGNKKK